jgi:molybdenum cofactor cytidylyltransferase
MKNGISLAEALRVKRGDVVSFVGGGGKTTSMFRLASELSAAGLRVLTTTTTHISQEQIKLAPASIGRDEIPLLKSLLDQHSHCLLIGPPDGKGRVYGASSELIASLHTRPGIDVILIEADGSRSRPFKAPGEHEPVVPDATTILAPIVGLHAIGQILDEDHAHRSEIIAALTQQKLGSTITIETIARVLSHPRGGAKQLPAGARLTPLLNSADTDAAVNQARDLADMLLKSSTIDTVAICSMIQDPPVREARTPVAGIVLAAGKAVRYGSTKQLLPWGDTTLVAHSARIALDAGLDPVIVVTGHDAASVGKALAGLPVNVVYNPDFASGQSASIRKGMEFLPERTGAALFLLADQPFVTMKIVKELVHAHRCTFAPACLPVFEEKRGNPVLFDKDVFPALRELQGDAGGRVLLETYRDRIVAVPASREILLDIDTVEDYETQKPGVGSQEPEEKYSG